MCDERVMKRVSTHGEPPNDRDKVSIESQGVLYVATALYLAGTILVR